MTAVLFFKPISLPTKDDINRSIASGYDQSKVFVYRVSLRIAQLAKLIFKAIFYIFKWMAAGVAHLVCVSLPLAHLIPRQIASIGENPDKAVKYSQAVVLSFNATVILIPLIEEILFRGILQNGVRSLVGVAFPEKNITLWTGKKIPVAEAVSIVVASIAFGAAHYLNGLGLVQPVICTVSGVVLGIISRKEGFAASTLMHMGNNAFAWSCMKLAASAA